MTVGGGRDSPNGLTLEKPSRYLRTTISRMFLQILAFTICAWKTRDKTRRTLAAAQGSMHSVIITIGSRANNFYNGLSKRYCAPENRISRFAFVGQMSPGHVAGTGVPR